MKENLTNREDSSYSGALDLYSFFRRGLYDILLIPLIQKGENLDKVKLRMISSGLKWQINRQDFNELPPETRNAYKKYFDFVKALEEASDSEIKKSIDVIKGHYSLGIECQALLGSNCTQKRIEMQSILENAIAKAGENGSLDLLNASEQMFNVCKQCPYKRNTQK